MFERALVRYEEWRERLFRAASERCKNASAMNKTGVPIMLKLAIIFGIISLISGALGFTGISGASAGIAKIIFGIFLFLLALAVLAIVLGIAVF